MINVLKLQSIFCLHRGSALFRAPASPAAAGEGGLPAERARCRKRAENYRKCV